MRVDPDIQGGVIGAHKHQRWVDIGRHYEGPEIDGGSLKRPRPRPLVTPSITGAVVPAGRSEPRDFALNRVPRKSGLMCERLEDDWRVALTRTIDIEAPATDIDVTADLR